MPTMKSAPEDLDARRPVWVALSSMFLDADVSLARESRAKALAALPYSLQELEQVLVEEVYPVCWSNLNAAAGERIGFNPDWLETMILHGDSPSAASKRLRELARIAVPDSTEWQATRAALASVRGSGTHKSS
jgi:hypothetical protein